MEMNEDSGFAALTLIETSLDTSYKLVFSDSFGCFLRSPVRSGRKNPISRKQGYAPADVEAARAQVAKEKPAEIVTTCTRRSEVC